MGRLQQTVKPTTMTIQSMHNRPPAGDEPALSAAAFAVATATAGSADPVAVARVAARQLHRALRPHALALFLRRSPDHLTLAATAGAGARAARRRWQFGLPVGAGQLQLGDGPAVPA